MAKPNSASKIIDTLLDLKENSGAGMPNKIQLGFSEGKWILIYMKDNRIGAEQEMSYVSMKDFLAGLDYCLVNNIKISVSGKKGYEI